MAEKEFIIWTYELLSQKNEFNNFIFKHDITLKKGLEVEIKCYSSSGLTDNSSIEYIIYINSYLLYKITILNYCTQAKPDILNHFNPVGRYKIFGYKLNSI